MKTRCEYIPVRSSSAIPASHGFPIFAIEPSRIQKTLWCVITLITLIVLWISPLPLWLIVVANLVAVGWCGVLLYQARKQKPFLLQQVDGNAWEMVTDSEIIELERKKFFVLTRWFVVLYFKERVVAIFSDSLPGPQFKAMKRNLLLKG